MATADVNFVSFNRRDDAFAYLAHLKLIPKSDGQAAIWIRYLEGLRWLHIADFDPTKTTMARTRRSRVTHY
jgi:hypothetical protein